MESAWCRACGQPQGTQLGACLRCGVDLAIDPPPEWPLGLVYEGRGTLGLLKRYGLCVGFEEESLLLHFSAKDLEPTRVPRATASPTTHVPSSLSPAARILHATGNPPRGASWNTDWLRQQVVELCKDIRVMRRLFDEALDLDWRHILDWVPLSPSEKSWRTAHHAAETGDVERLRTALGELPVTGYENRASLVLPHLHMVRSDGARWRPIAQAMLAARADHALEVLVASLGAPAKALENAVAFLPEPARDYWLVTSERLSAGHYVPPPPVPGQPAWQAASLISSPEHFRILDGYLQDLVGVDLSLLDDLVDAGRLTSAAPLADRPEASRSHLLARLDPSRLTDGELAAGGLLDERARRSFVARDRATLFGLEPTPRVLHYQALLDVVEGGLPDPARLDEATMTKLARPEQVMNALKAGEIRTLPDEVADDPSLWPMFSDLAIRGVLLPDTSRRAGHPLNTWIGLLRLLGLLWEGDFAEAADHGQQLRPHLARERQQDEAASLTAFALDQLGRSEEALRALEDALRGEYTENLLVNVSVIASKVAPDVGVRHLARIVEEAPTPDLQRAALRRALGVWQATSEPFPQVLVPILRRLLSIPASLEDYLEFGRAAVSAVPDLMIQVPNPGEVYDGPWRIFRARARFKVESDFFLRDLASEYVDVHRGSGTAEWFKADWQSWVDLVEESVFVDFGDATGSAEFVDEVLTKAPGMFSQRERFVLAPQAGAHLAATFAKTDSWLNERAWAKFFFEPIDSFLATRATLEPGLAEHLTDNFALCLGTAAFRMAGMSRDKHAAEFNTIIQRLRWDSEHAFELYVARGRVLESVESGPLVTLDAAVQRLRRLASEERRKLTNDLADFVDEWRREINKLKGD